MTTHATAENSIDCIDRLSDTERRALDTRAGELAPGSSYVGIDTDYRIHYHSPQCDRAVVFDSAVDTRPQVHDLAEIATDEVPKRLGWVETVSQIQGGRGWIELRMRPAVLEKHLVSSV